MTTDLDLCLVDSAAATVYGCADDNNSATGLASEFSSWTGSASPAWVIVRYSGTNTPRLKLISHRSGLTSVQYNTGCRGDIVGPTIFGHNASIPGVTVAAVPYDDSSVLEAFSSFGPALYCWQPVDGLPAALRGAVLDVVPARAPPAPRDGLRRTWRTFGGETLLLPSTARVRSCFTRSTPGPSPQRSVERLVRAVQDAVETVSLLDYMLQSQDDDRDQHRQPAPPGDWATIAHDAIGCHSRWHSAPVTPTQPYRRSSLRRMSRVSRPRSAMAR